MKQNSPHPTEGTAEAERIQLAEQDETSLYYIWDYSRPTIFFEGCRSTFRSKLRTNIHQPRRFTRPLFVFVSRDPWEKRKRKGKADPHFCSGRGSHSFLRRIKEDRVRCEAYLMVSPVGLVFGLLFLVTKKIGRCGKDQQVSKYHFRSKNGIKNQEPPDPRERREHSLSVVPYSAAEVPHFLALGNAAPSLSLDPYPSIHLTTQMLLPEVNSPKRQTFGIAYLGDCI